MPDTEPVIMYAVYHRPFDFPDDYVVRIRRVFPGMELPGGLVAVTHTYAEARAKIPDGLMRLGHMPQDHPSILEVWCPPEIGQLIKLALEANAA